DPYLRLRAARLKIHRHSFQALRITAHQCEVRRLRFQPEPGAVLRNRRRGSHNDDSFSSVHSTSHQTARKPRANARIAVLGELRQAWIACLEECSWHARIFCRIEPPPCLTHDGIQALE